MTIEVMLSYIDDNESLYYFVILTIVLNHHNYQVFSLNIKLKDLIGA